MATLLKTDGTSTEIEPANGKKFTCKELYKLLNCDTVEVIDLMYGTGPKDDILIGDEEGRLIDEPIENPLATKLYRERWGVGKECNIVGDVIFCKNNQF